jgi:hypothetical protein
VIASDDGLDTGLARLLHQRGALDVETLRSVLRDVRGARVAGGGTLAHLLSSRGLVADAIIDEALDALRATRDASAERSTTDAAELPQDLGPYRVVAKLASGGMGTVWELEHAESGGRFALKTLLPGALLGDSGGDERTRFQREGEALAKLDHPHVVRIHAGEFRTRIPYMIQDLLPGGTLQARLETGAFPPARAVELMLKLASGIAHAHDHGLLHRDLKPLNVLFDDRDQPRVVDFGLVRSVEGSSLTHTGELLGTPSYMAPEQVLGEAVDERTDVYGLGGILYALLTGGPPFRGQGLGILAAVVNDDPSPPGVLPWLDAVCLRALAKDPNQRFSSALAFARALQAEAEVKVHSAQRRRRRGMVAVLGIGALLLAASSVVSLGHSALAERERAAAAEVQAEVEKRLAQRVTLAELRDELPGWSERVGKAPPLELGFVRALLAADAGDLENLGALSESLEKRGLAPQRMRILRAAATLLRSGSRGVGEAALALREGRGGALPMRIVDLYGWEARLRVQSGSDSDYCEVLPLLDVVLDVRGSLSALELRALERSLLRRESPPPRSETKSLEGLPCIRRAAQARAIVEGFGQVDPVALLRFLTELGTRPHRFVLGEARKHGTAWASKALRLLPSDPLVNSVSPEGYGRLAAWWHVSERLELQAAFARYRKQSTHYALQFMPYLPPIEDNKDTQKIDIDKQWRGQSAQGEFLRSVAELLPPVDAAPVWGRLVEYSLACVSAAQGPYAEGLDHLAALLLDPHDQAWARALAGLARAHLAQARFPALGLARECVQRLAGLRVEELPTSPPNDPRLKMAKQRFQHAGAVVAYARAVGQLLVGHPEQAKITLAFVASLPPKAQRGIQGWASLWVKARWRVSGRLAPPERAAERLDLAAFCMRHLRSESPLSGTLLGHAYLLRAFLSPSQRREVLDLLARPHRPTFATGIWFARHASMALEEGEVESALGALRAAATWFAPRHNAILGKRALQLVASIEEEGITPGGIDQARGLAEAAVE